MHLPCIQFSKNNTGFCPEPKAQRRKRHTLAALFLKPWSFILFRLNPSNVLGGGERERTDDLPAWEAGRSPLAYNPCLFSPLQISLVEVNGIEPMTSCVQGRRSPN